MSEPGVPAIALEGISRRFGEVEANKDVSLSVAPGTIHALVGENGAGKSTLMKIAYGHLHADAGTIAIKGEQIARQTHSPARSIARGLGMVFQHFMLVGPLTVVENVVLGREPGSWHRLDLATPRRELVELAGRYGLEVDVSARIDDLGVGESQRVEILKVLWQGCDVLILDEPTAVLTPREVDALFGVLRALVAAGGTVVLITHKLDEVAAVADRITVMRRGEVVTELDARGVSPREIATAMVGRPVSIGPRASGLGSQGSDPDPSVPEARGPRPEALASPPVLEVSDLRVARKTGGDAVAGVSLTVRAGEILGIAGVIGNGQSELCDAITGLVVPAAGTIRIAGTDMTALSVAARRAAGVATVPEDRHQRGLVLDLPVEENLVLLGDPRMPWRIDRRRLRADAVKRLADADIRPADPELPARALSGGNQQKIVIARELSREPRLLVCAQPTRGVDIGAIEAIHRRILAARDRGLAVLLVSAELTELLALSDRIAVMHRGAIAATLDRPELSAEGAVDRIGALMTGAGAPA